MTVFIFIPWFLPAYKAGGPIQSIANMVEQFNEEISYKIVCSNTDLDGTVLNVPANSWINYNENTQIWYSSNNKLSIAVLKKQMIHHKVDIIFINGIYSWFFNIVPLLFGNASRKIVSVRGMLYSGALSQKYFKKKIYLFLWKILGLHKKCEFHASNDEEKKSIQNIFGKKIKIFVAQNFPRIFPRLSFPEKKESALQIVSIALISPMKNHLLILNALMKCYSNISYNIYGSVKDHSYWNSCEEQIKKMPANIIVNYYGDILPGDVEFALTKSHIFILPSKSENFGHAIYEALSAGRPVITSNNTPWNNLQQSKAGINIAPEEPEELINAIKYFAAMNNCEFEQWSTGANQYAVNAINVDTIKHQYKKMFFP